MGETKPEESLGALDVAVVVADDHHVILVPGQGGRNGQAGQDGCQYNVEHFLVIAEDFGLVEKGQR